MSRLIKQRWGKFCIGDATLQLAQTIPVCSCGVSVTGGEHVYYCHLNNDNDVDPLYELFGQMIIVRAEHLIYKAATEYVAHSNLFDECREGMEIPAYQMIYNGELKTWKAQRQN